MKIYVASSWRNNRQPLVVIALRKAGHEVYDFKHPKPGDNGFHWSEIDPEWQDWDSNSYIKALSSPVAESGFNSDWDAMEWSELCVLVLPSGRSSHLEAGCYPAWGKKLIILLDDTQPMEPELMYKMADFITPNIDEMISAIKSMSVKPCKVCGYFTHNGDCVKCRPY